MRIGRVGWFELMDGVNHHGEWFKTVGIGIAVVTEVQPEAVKVKTTDGNELVVLKGSFHSIPDNTPLAIKVRELTKVELFYTEEEKQQIEQAKAAAKSMMAKLLGYSDLMPEEVN